MSKRSKKMVLAAALSLLAAMLLTLAPAAGGVGDYEYSVNDDGSVVITAYYGKSAQVAIPGTLGGRPVSGVGEGALAGHDEIRELYIAEGVSEISDSAFEGCASLVSLTLPASVVSLGERAFAGCASLAELIFSDGLLKIGPSAFEGCSSLAYAYLPATLASVGTSAFAGCPSLGFVVAENSSALASYGAGCFGRAKLYAFAGSSAELLAASEKLAFSAVLPLSGIKYIPYGAGIRITSSAGGAEAVVVPAYIDGKRVVSVGESAFSADAGRGAGVRIILLPDTVREIGVSAFASSSALEYIRLPRVLDGDIGQYAFKNCASLRSVSIPEGVARVGLQTFSGCAALRRVELPASVTRVAAEAFRDCASLTELIFRGGEPACEYKNTLPSLVSFAGVGDMTVYVTDATGWALTDGKWYPNGSGWDYSGYRVVATGHECFYIERVIEAVSCDREGVSEFYCPFCRRSYAETYPRIEHNFVSTGINEGVEVFRCTGCDANYVRYHMEFAVIEPVVDPDKPRGSMLTSVKITFGGKPLSAGTDYTVAEIYNKTYDRVELTFAGAGEYVGERRLVYRLSDRRWLSAYTVTAVGATGGGQYYQNDLVELRPIAPPEGSEVGEWSISGGLSFMSQGRGGASFIMPAGDVTVTLTFKKIAVTTTPVTTPPPPVTDPPVTETEPVTETTEPETDPVTEPDTGEETTKPYRKTEDGQEYIRKALLWGGVLFLSLAVLIGASIILFKKDKNQQ